jgi:HAD superfamily hydrolase (TIGR01490 family)
MTKTEGGANGIAFFDLDHTLVDGDSDSSFIDFMEARGLLAPGILEAKEPINQAYMEGRPWQPEYRELLRRIYRDQSVSGLEELARIHAEECVVPMLFAGARDLLAKERAKRDEIVLLTTTNQIVTTPLLGMLGLDGLLSSRLEAKGELYTGEVEGDFCTGPGKATRLRAYCEARGVDPAHCAMYGDGRSDMDALAAVGQPVAVHPNDELAATAARHDWPVLNLG